MDFDGEQVEDLSNAELMARISNMVDLACQCLREGTKMAPDNIDSLDALIDELSCREL